MGGSTMKAVMSVFDPGGRILGLYTDKKKEESAPAQAATTGEVEAQTIQDNAAQLAKEKEKNRRLRLTQTVLTTPSLQSTTTESSKTILGGV